MLQYHRRIMPFHTFSDPSTCIRQIEVDAWLRWLTHEYEASLAPIISCLLTQVRILLAGSLAPNQPTILSLALLDLLHPSYEAPSRNPTRQSQVCSFNNLFAHLFDMKIDVSNEELRTQLKTLRYELQSVTQDRDLLDARRSRELRDLQAKWEEDVKRLQVCSHGTPRLV